MGMLIMPAIQAGTAVVARSMPALANAAKRYSGTAFAALGALTGSKDPVALAQSIATSRNGMQAQAYMYNAVQAGVSLEMIASAVPMLTSADMDMLRAYHVEHHQRAANAVSAAAVVVPGDDVVTPPSPEIILSIKKLCGLLTLSLADLEEVLIAVHTVTPIHTRQLARWQASSKTVVQR